MELEYIRSWYKAFFEAVRENRQVEFMFWHYGASDARS